MGLRLAARSFVVAAACILAGAGTVRAGSLLPPTPWLTVEKSPATGGVVLSWDASAGSFSVLRSRDASFFAAASVRLAAWGVESGTFADPVLGDGNLYFYSVESDDAASHRESIGRMLAHATLYGDATRATAPAVFDQWTEIFRGRRITRSNQNEPATVTLAQCGSGDCDAPVGTLCIADPDGDGAKSATDPSGDGRPEFAEGDVVFVGSAQPGSGWDPKHLAHAITTIRDGDGAVCPSGTRNQWSLADRIAPGDEPIAPGAPITNLWLNSSHPIESGYFLLGYRLGTATGVLSGSSGDEPLGSGPELESRSAPGDRVARADATPIGTDRFLIHDPGSRTVVITGDSWAVPYHPLAAGLNTALEERYPGRRFHVVATGVGGKRAGQVLQEWDALVAPHDPLYVVFVVGTNDCAGSSAATPLDRFVADVTRLAMKSLAHGAIPIFAGVAPTTRPDGTGFPTCRAFRFYQRRALQDLVP